MDLSYFALVLSIAGKARPIGKESAVDKRRRAQIQTLQKT